MRQSLVTCICFSSFDKAWAISGQDAQTTLRDIKSSGPPGRKECDSFHKFK